MVELRQYGLVGMGDMSDTTELMRLRNQRSGTAECWLVQQADLA